MQSVWLRAVAADMGDGAVDAVDELRRDDDVEVFAPPVLGGGGDRAGNVEQVRRRRGPRRRPRRGR